MSVVWSRCLAMRRRSSLGRLRSMAFWEVCGRCLSNGAQL